MTYYLFLAENDLLQLFVLYLVFHLLFELL